VSVLEDLIADATAGDPVTSLKWTRKTSRKLSSALKRCGYRVGPDTVRRLLRASGYTFAAIVSASTPPL
jgi:3-methyladenine DNA glycosylase Tag